MKISCILTSCLGIFLILFQALCIIPKLKQEGKHLAQKQANQVRYLHISQAAACIITTKFGKWMDSAIKEIIIYVYSKIWMVLVW